MHGYFEIGIVHGKTEYNIGTLWRSAYQLGASGIFTVGKRYSQQCSDTTKAWRHIPLRNYETFEEFYNAIPYDCQLIGVEMGGDDLREFSHPKRCVYLLGAEDHGLSPEIAGRCHGLVSIGSLRVQSYNVAVAGSIVMYDRFSKA